VNPRDPEGGGPAVSLEISGDAMGAKLRLGAVPPDGWKARFPGPAALHDWLVGQGIVHEAIRADVVEWMAGVLSAGDPPQAALEELQSVEVAEGLAPVHEEPIGLAFQKGYLSNAEAIADLRRKADHLGFEGLRDAIDPEYWVASGETVARWHGASPARPGRDVFGAPIPPQRLVERLPPFGKSLATLENRLVAVCDGALILEDGLLKVLGADSMPACQVVVAEDGMSANLVLGGTAVNDWQATLEMVRAALRDQGVQCMVPESEILSALNRFNFDRRPVTLLVSRGRPPVPGSPARLSLLVDPEPEAPRPGPDGSIDFKAFKYFRTVQRGQRLARVLPPKPGMPGMDVHGREIPPDREAEAEVGLGKNTAYEAGDPEFVVATRPGRLAVKAGVPEVVEVLEVAGDVSLKTGNISFPGAVRIGGDVHVKMAVECGGDVEVEGTVEDSRIRTDGAIVIKGGVNGMGAGLIKSRFSSVTIGYLHNQRIESATHIVVYNEIIASQLLARETIKMIQGRYSVLGGHLLAGREIDLFNVGSESGVKTVLEVGKDFEIEAEMESVNGRLQADAQDMEFLREMESQLTRVLRVTRGGSDEDQLLFRRTEGAIDILSRRIAAFKDQLAELGRRLHLQGICEVKVRGQVHPGTVIKYRDQVLVVPAGLRNRRWIFRESGARTPAEGIPLLF
jgi:uncharacterized protein (DUF342 family)